ncbi:DNA-processing protein DprA [Pedococcus sp. 2YAF34]|uniref:DNA-processing protein DprA n=1 Tax=Pedococcus sp. 2YAF34 TaxID=3233032 RepID=UPI003F95FF14
MTALPRLRVPEGDRAARVAWARLVEPGDPAAARLVGAVGAEQALHGLDPASALAQRLLPRLETLDVVRDLEIARALGARLVVPGDEEWPAGLDGLAAPPFCLWVKGPLELREACARSVAVVGARAATGYGVHQARELAAGLAERRFTVVSGAAYGIDGAAHEGALAVYGATVAVVAGGLDRPYPAGHAGLLGRITAVGAVVSEVPPGSSPTRWRFLSRNRLIATMTQGTVVVEAGLRSGSRNTATTARDHHRVVCAVPGPVSSAASAGCHVLIRDGAILVTDAAEVAQEVGPIGELAPHKEGPYTPEDDLEPVHRAVLGFLRVHASTTAEDVARQCGTSTAEAVSALGILVANDLAARDQDGYRRARRPSPT